MPDIFRLTTGVSINVENITSVHIFMFFMAVTLYHRHLASDIRHADVY